MSATPRILIIAGSDSGGGAGIQADIKTITMMGGHAMTAITAITAQNTLGVDAVMAVPAEMVLAQIEAVVSDIGADGVKIGMIGSADTAEAVAERLGRLRGIPVVFDPVMIATSGSVLADPATIAAFDRLMALATLVTPNAPELDALSPGLGGREMAARALSTRTGAAVLAKGGDLIGPEVTDILIENGQETEWRDRRIDTQHTHGTGCTLASAVAVGIARGEPLVQAVAAGRTFVRSALVASPEFGGGHGPMGHWAATSGRLNLNQATVHAADYDQSVAFYLTLGLQQIVASPPRYARFEAPGGATLSIHAQAGVQAGSDTILYFETAALDELVERLRGGGLVFESLPQDQPWGWREARLRDPAGNPICLYYAGENRRYPPWRLAPRA